MRTSTKVKLKIRVYLNRVSDVVSRPWSDLRGVSNSYAAKSTILIPLIGYYLIFNERIVKWLNLAKEFVGAPVVDQVPIRVLWLYMGLCSIALGTIIYALRCPPEVKKYGDYKDYVNGDGPAMSASTMSDIEKEIEKRGYALEGRISKADYLALNFHELNFSATLSRWTVIVCFVIGFVVLMVLSGQVFWKAAILLYRSPFGN